MEEIEFKAPEWWWTDPVGKPLRYVYKAMRTDFRDLIPAQYAMLIGNKKSPYFMGEVMQAIIKGDTDDSIFFHATESFWSARINWLRLRHASGGGDTGKQILVRIDLWGLWTAWLSANGKPNSIEEFYMVNISTHAHAQKFFQDGPRAYGEIVEKHFDRINAANAYQEVLLCYRGRLNLQHFEVCDHSTDALRGPLLGVRAVRHWLAANEYWDQGYVPGDDIPRPAIDWKTPEEPPPSPSPLTPEDSPERRSRSSKKRSREGTPANVPATPLWEAAPPPEEGPPLKKSKPPPCPKLTSGTQPTQIIPAAAKAGCPPASTKAGPPMPAGNTLTTSEQRETLDFWTIAAGPEQEASPEQEAVREDKARAAAAAAPAHHSQPQEAAAAPADGQPMEEDASTPADSQAVEAAATPPHSQPQEAAAAPADSQPMDAAETPADAVPAPSQPAPSVGFDVWGLLRKEDEVADWREEDMEREDDPKAGQQSQQRIDEEIDAYAAELTAKAHEKLTPEQILLWEEVKNGKSGCASKCPGCNGCGGRTACKALS